MKRAWIAGGAVAVLVLALVAGYRALEPEVERAAATPAVMTRPTPQPPAPAGTHPATETHQGFLYGRVTTVEGVIYEGRLRWGGDQEAFWDDYFNGFKEQNPWLAQVPPELRPKKRRLFQILGIKIAERESPIDGGRPFMRRFGDIARMETRGRDVRVTLKSGAVFDLDRFESSDFDDGVRVWDGRRGVVDLDSLRIGAIEFLPTARLEGPPARLHGTVRTPQGEFTGFIQWNREECVGTDELDGRTADAEIAVRFDTIRSITRQSRDSAVVALRDGREMVLADTREVGHESRGINVDDRRYGRVLVSWGAFERVDFSPGDSGPAYDAFPPGRPLTGAVTTRAGRRLAGRLVYDLDESETTETLDAPSQGVDYTLPLGLIASIVCPGRDAPSTERAKLTLHDGEELQLERSGDLGDGNAGLLVFVPGGQRPEYVAWTDVGRIDFDRPQR
jgi:hypothetical protein